MAYPKASSKLVCLALFLLWTGTLAAVFPAKAQGRLANDRFAYTVQPGDTLLLVALQYNLALTDIILTNDITPPYLIFPGQRLLLPGVSMSQRFLVELPPLRAAPHVVQAGDSLSEIAGRYGVSLGSIMLVNDLSDPDLLQIGQTLRIPEGPLIPEPLEAPFAQVILSKQTVVQGQTLVVKVRLTEPADLSGSFEGRSLFFAENNDGYRWGLIAIHALAESSVYPIALTATRSNGTEVTAITNVTVVEGPYGSENIQLDDARGELLNDELIQREREKLASLWSQVSPRPHWAGPFRYPVAGKAEITSDFGTRRSYNGSPTTSFHGGSDFGGGVGTPIYAAAAGTVVMAENLPLRGNAVLIDHGMGLFSGYWHQTQLVVAEGQPVQAGDLLGYVGSTGLVTGPHLHWELRLQGIAVDPVQWVVQTIP